MTFAAAAPTSTPPAARDTVSIVILGTDALLAAHPATPVQLAHACLRAGFANVIPASWGDELVAAAVLRRLPEFGSGPAIQCSCPIVAHRLLTSGGDLRPVMLPLVSPPVAAARYVRSLARPAIARITYVGACPGAVDESIDIRMTPEALIALLAERNIRLDEQPRVFESVIPPDRRRFRSLPGGVPAPEMLWADGAARSLVEAGGDDFVAEIAQHLLAGENVLIDASVRLGCACAGAVHGAREPRQQVAMLEPPRATSPVVDESPAIDLEMPVPAVTRTPVDVVAVRTPPAPMPAITPEAKPTAEPVAQTATTARTPQENRPTRAAGGAAPRPVLSAFPVARDAEGRALPRAYVARRRSTPRGISAVQPSSKPAPAARTSEASAKAMAPEPSTKAATPEVETRQAFPETPAPVGAPPMAMSIFTPAAAVAAHASATAYAPPAASTVIAERQQATLAPGAPLATSSGREGRVVDEASTAIPTARLTTALDEVLAPTSDRALERDTLPASAWYPSPSASQAPPVSPTGPSEPRPRPAAPPRESAPVTPRTTPSASQPSLLSQPLTTPAIPRVRPRPTPAASTVWGFSRGQRWIIVLAITVIAACATTVAAFFVARTMESSSAPSHVAR